MVKRICVITGTRAEYGLLKPLIMKIIDDKEIDLKLVVTGMHMSTEFGLTYKLIEEDGIVIDEKIEILLSSDSHVATSKAMGLAIISFSEYINRTKPDMVIVLGDRYEILAASISAMVANVPIAHIHGGEITEGAQDDVFRHCITKLSYLHFTSTESYRKRVMQLGEEPNRVFNVGAIGIENIKELKLLSKEEIEKSINFTLNKKFALVTFHPVTLEQGLAEIQITELLGALEEFDDRLPEIKEALGDNDVLIITADHGCDPTTEGTDHSREYVPVLVYGRNLKEDINLGTRNGFCDIGKTVLDLLDIENDLVGKSFKDLIV